MRTTGQPIDINPTHLEMIQSILDEHVPGCEVRAFGSRAKWSASDYSDLDLAVVGDQPVEWRTLGRLKDALEESTLPFRVDVLDWHDISDNFREIIRGDCTVIKTGNQSSEPTLSKWPTKHFGDCATLIRESISPSSVGDIPYIGLEHIGEGTLSLLDHGVASDVTSTKSSFKKDDILFGKLRPYFRKVIRAPFDGICSTDIWVIRAKDGVDQGYLYYCTASQPFVDFATAGSIGTRMPRAKWDYVSQYRLPVPTLSEQRNKAHILKTLDDKIELNRRMNETLEAMAQTLFKSWFVDFDPVCAKIEGRWRPGESLPGLPAHLYDLFPDRLVSSKLGEIPEGWKTGVLDDAIEVLNGGTPSTVVDQYWDGEIPWYTAKDAPNLSDIFVVKTERTITPLGVQNSPTRILPKGTTIISARGSVGKLALLGTPMAFNQTCYGIRSRSHNLDFFIYWVIRTLTKQIGSKAHGTIFDTITRQTFRLIDIIYPSTHLTIEFQSSIQPLMANILSNLKELALLTNLRSSLLSELTSGKLRKIREREGDQS